MIKEKVCFSSYLKFHLEISFYNPELYNALSPLRNNFFWIQIRALVMSDPPDSELGH